MSGQGLDWYKRDPRAFVEGVQGLGPEVIGAYAVLLDLMYARGGAIRRDDRHLSGVLGCSVRKAKSLTDALIDTGKIVSRDDYLTNKRVETEAKRKRNERELRANAQRERRENERGSNENKGLADKGVLSEAPLEKEKEKDKEKNTPLTPRGGGGVEDEFEEWWHLCPRKVGKGQAKKAYRRARKVTDRQTLTDGIKRFALSVHGKDAKYICYPATWLNGERWADVEGVDQPSQKASDADMLALRVDRVEDWLSRNEFIHLSMDREDTANALLAKGWDYQELRRRGFSLPVVGNVIPLRGVANA